MDDDGEEQLIARPYQTQLEEIAIQKNTIIHLPTGSGKTFIAIRVINRLKDSIRKPWGHGAKRTFFLVNTVPLVQQQKRVIEKLSQAKRVAGYSGEDGVDYWNKTRWNTELAQNEVIVMTSQILADMLTHAYIGIENINLLIFDECHHAVIDHPMRLVMKHFDKCPVEKQPRVLGLSATLLNCNVTINTVEENLRLLETTFHATIATADAIGQVLRYSTNPQERIRYYTTCVPTSAAEEAIEILTELQELVQSVKLPTASNPDIKLERGQRDIVAEKQKTVKEVKNMVRSMVMLIEEFGVYGGALGILAYIILMERLKRKTVCLDEERLYKFVITHSLMARMVLLKSMEKDTGYAKIIKHSSPKVLELLNILKEFNPDYYNAPGVLMKVNTARKPLSGIIFTQQRFTAKILFNFLKDVKEANPKDFDFLKHDFIVGFAINPYKSTREQYFWKKASMTTLLKFTNKELNCLISTSVIEEGVDIPQCMLVVRYDPPLEYRSYIQSKVKYYFGRARSSDSNYVLMINEANKCKFLKQYHDYQITEKYIQNILVGHSDERDAPTQDEIQEGLYEDDLIPPYITSNGNRLSAVSAASLLNRYCSMLPHDQFTTLAPMWVEEKVKDKNGDILRLVKIYMPIACPIKEAIQGLPLHSLKDAKRSASLNACIRLHQEKELDDITLLPKRYGVVDFERPEVGECFPNWQDNDFKEDHTKPGTKKRTRKHPKVFPSILKGTSANIEKQTYYLHILKIKTNFNRPDDSRERALYDILQTPQGYGFLTLQSLPKLCNFPMFLTVGEVKTSLEVNFAVIQLDNQLLQIVKSFHYFVFDQVLEVVKKFTIFSGDENCLYVVPVMGTNDYDIDWDIMRTFTTIPVISEPSPEEQAKPLDVTKKNYQYYVVSPWYRGSLFPDRYIVSDVLEYKTPNSLLDPLREGTYADYYFTKYNMTILGNPNQPLLEVRNISSRMNCLMPRAASIALFTEKQRKLISLNQGDDKPKGFTENFIPEFCTKYEYPGTLWFKATMLPSVVHRIFMLLVAYELREEIAISTNYGPESKSLTHEWKPIELNMQVAVKALLSQIEDPAPITCIDRINNPIDGERTHINIKPMKDCIYELQKKKIHKDFPWDENTEPIDIERNISSVTVMDIECYDEFVSAVIPDPVTVLPPQPLQPSSRSAAILPPPVKYLEKITILDKTLNGRGPELRDILASITTITSQDTFHLERVETLGDSFLKFAASMYLFQKFPKLDEGQLTNIKSRMIGNRNLYYAGTRVNLGGRMKIDPFSPRKDFLVPGYFAPQGLHHFIESNKIRPTFLIGLQFSREEAISGKLSAESWVIVEERCKDEDSNAEIEPECGAQNAMQCYVRSQAVSDKAVADCVEALIGTYLLDGGIQGAIKILEWLRIIPQKDDFAKRMYHRMPTIFNLNKATAEEIDRIMNHSRADIEEIINYKFKDPALLLEAMSHPSFIKNRMTRSYERLEFLGDAVLDFLITSYIFEHCGELKPGQLTDLRSALVNNVTFAAFVVKLGLHKHLCYQLNPVLESAIVTFIEHQERRNHCIVEDVLYLIDEEDCHIADYIEVPKVLSDIFESLMGAIYLDSGANLKVVWTVIYAIMYREIHEFSRAVPIQPVKMLYENIHACPSFGTPQIPDPNISKVMVPVTFTKNGSQQTVYGFGTNKFQAKRAAAKLALKILGL